MHNPGAHNRQSIWLRDFDYAGTGGYFVTVCTWRREYLFGDVVDGDMRLNDVGMVVRDQWLRTPQIRTNVALDEFVVMPNHFHAIMWIIDPVGARRAVPLVNHPKRFNGQRPPVGARRAVPAFDHAVVCPNIASQNQGTVSQNQGTVLRSQGTARRAPTVEKFGRPVAGSLATIVRSFKSAATKRINTLRGNPGSPVWQRNYYEHVIRGDRDLYAARQYITDNPTKWELDINHPTQI
ncbi:transposase [Geoalkalibacter halelectricus]|uniref:Transposase IS200-like domain-containing protein n=1 Tax=Geoalkalibacter halelectricus TaxID=2847045 RepID=A0ABY5ZLE2_9BACT|nr:transposase [Geoalkalibacter halelectricus]MDO3379741.1 hypothetical protein [Geoalkalibacter halelectricus]UWZ79274.1 hypothetical protein L9S41_16565 [Geoalkalibacter halelectricus]